ncbi:lysozyme family protein [Constrictibacter sp. MBR-5]|jgi:lysozyme family protein|uniref:glycoside hydrolase family 108 protein n=1 Tax=Constrictibacter sp. MBR-5 TaxID=3156467 RepID=UPI003394EB9A
MIDPIDEVLRHEGEYTDNPKDKGNWLRGKLVGTKYGITGATLASWLGRSVTKDDVKNLTEEEAREIYEIRYLTGPRIHTLPNPPQTLILDMAVNHGQKTAIMMLQRVLNKAGFGPVDTDGIMGPQTRNATIKAQSEMGNYLQNAIVEERINLYKAIVRNDASQRTYIRGWLNRAESFRL